jgi:hypothetical protein
MRLLAAATRLHYSVVQEIDVTKRTNCDSLSQYYDELNCSQSNCTSIITAVSLSTDKQTLLLLAVYILRTLAVTGED